METVCQNNALHCFLVSPTSLAYLSWVSFFITFIGLVVAIWQINKVKNSADRARDTVEKLSYHVDGVNLAYINAQMGSINHLIHTGDYNLAEIAFMNIKRSIRLQAKALSIEEQGADDMKRAIGRISKQLQWGIAGSPSFDANKAKRYVDDLIGLVTDWEANVAQKSKMGIVNEND